MFLVLAVTHLMSILQVPQESDASELALAKAEVGYLAEVHSPRIHLSLRCSAVDAADAVAVGFHPRPYVRQLFGQMFVVVLQHLLSPFGRQVSSCSGDAYGRLCHRRSIS